jgi:hypothetical protein
MKIGVQLIYNLMNSITYASPNPDCSGKPTAKRSISEDLQRKAGNYNYIEN